MPTPVCAHCGARFAPSDPVHLRRGPAGQREFLHQQCRHAPPRVRSARLSRLQEELERDLQVAQDWDPRLDLTSSGGRVVVSATDLADAGEDDACGRHLAFKARPSARLRAWRRRYDPDGAPFPLGDVVDLVLAAHAAQECRTWEGQRAWLERRLSGRDLHRLVRPFVQHAVEAALDAHHALEVDDGPRRLLARDPVVGQDGRQLTVWGPLYVADGPTGPVHEVRRFRLGPARTATTGADERWTAAAAVVAGLAPAEREPVRVRVVEVGCSDGSTHVALDADLDEVLERYRDLVAPALPLALAGTAASAGWSCGRCKVTGGCEQLLQVEGALGRSRPGRATRTLSASLLDAYERCPARALMERTLHLPRDGQTTEAQARGVAVHRWLELAHRTGEGCAPGVLPEELSDEDPLALVAAFQAQHAAVCPLGRGGVEAVLVEDPVHAWDGQADVLLASTPDLVYLDQGQPVVRETKTALRLPASPQQALQQHLQVPLMLVQLAAGLFEELPAAGAAGPGRVELEVLTPDAAVVLSWDAGDPAVVAAARDRVAAVVGAWHEDVAFSARPGAHCGTCPVRRWCPDEHEGVPAGARPRGG